MLLFACNLKAVQHRPTKLNDDDDDDVLSYRDGALTRSQDPQAVQLWQGRNIRRQIFVKTLSVPTLHINIRPLSSGSTS